MRILYLDCGMGAAGDMLTAALLELLPEPEQFVERLNHLGMPGVKYRAVPEVRCGIHGTRMMVTVHGKEEGERMDPSPCAAGKDAQEKEPHHSHDDAPAEGCHPSRDDAPEKDHHSHSGMEEIRRRVEGLDLPGKVREDVLAVYDLIAQAESTVHGVPVSQIHFHEVGAWDAVADITAVCLLLQELHPDRIAASPIHVGGGSVRCAHGVLPVPAPATELLLRGIPSVGGPVESELCTPTGAALLRYFVQDFGPQPAMMVDRVGYGCGRKEFKQANCVRAVTGNYVEWHHGVGSLDSGWRQLLQSADLMEKSSRTGDFCGTSVGAGASEGDGEEDVSVRRSEESGGQIHRLISLECNLDDMTPEAIGFAMEELLLAGAMDVYTTSVGMKKNRPGVLLTCICHAAQREEMLRLMFRHTTTLGIRETEHPYRYALERSGKTIDTPYGAVRVKRSTGWGTENKKAEYEDLAAIARNTGRPLKEISREISQILAME